MISSLYHGQVDLLLRVLPLVAEERCFGLKGGTAINLFVRDLPRLSVDIDLTYLLFDKRSDALRNISEGLSRIKKRIEELNGDILVTEGAKKNEDFEKLICASRRAQIKIEVNTVMRGKLFESRLMKVSDSVQKKFGKFASIQVVSHSELYGGKVCAALDRQHPRDLFDIFLFLKKEAAFEEIKDGFIAALLSHPRPINEVLVPNYNDMNSVFETQFVGMTDLDFSYADYEKTRLLLGKTILKALTQNDKEFLISFKKGKPNWELTQLPQLEKMPAIQWKLLNIQKLARDNPLKHKGLLSELTKKLEKTT